MLKVILKTKFSTFYLHLTKNMIEVEMVFFQWLVCIFCYHIPKHVTNFVWTRLFIEGDKAILKCILAFIKVAHDEVLEINNHFEIITFFDKTFFEKIDMSLLREVYNSIKIKIPLEKSEPIELRRKPEKNKDKIKEYVKKIYLGMDLNHIQEIQCYDNWPICIFDHCYESINLEFFVFSIEKTVEIIPDYFNANTENNILPLNKLQKNLFEYKTLVVERNPHYCHNKLFTNYLIKYLTNESKESDTVFSHFSIYSENLEEIQSSYYMNDFINHMMEVINRFENRKSISVKDSKMNE